MATPDQGRAGLIGCDAPGHPQNYSHDCAEWNAAVAIGTSMTEPWVVTVQYVIPGPIEDTDEAITAAVLRLSEPDDVMVHAPGSTPPELRGGFYRAGAWREATR